MAVSQTLLDASALPRAVPAPYRTPPDPEALRPSAATLALVGTQVDALLAASPAYHRLPGQDQHKLRDAMAKVAAYAAECVRDDWLQSERLGQRPLVRYRERRVGPLVRAQEGFQPGATAQVARVTQDTLKAIAFPTFVADLIKGTFEAITNSSIRQMEAYMRLLENVGMTVDQFMDSNISDDQARDWLSQRYPDHIQVSNRKLAVRDGSDERRAPDFQADLNLSGGVSLDEDSMEETLVPAARRRLAQMRLQMLSTLVLMGINRIVVTGGKIRATMLFHIDASDRLRQEHATDMDFRSAASGSFGFGPWSVSASVSFAYVSSDRSVATSDLNVSADLTGEVEIHFKSDYFPLERFAPTGDISRIQSNTAVPQANTPNVSEAVPWGGATPAAPASARGHEPLPRRCYHRRAARCRPPGRPPHPRHRPPPLVQAQGPSRLPAASSRPPASQPRRRRAGRGPARGRPRPLLPVGTRLRGANPGGRPRRRAREASRPRPPSRGCPRPHPVRPRLVSPPRSHEESLTVLQTLPPPYATPASSEGVRPTPAVEHLVRSQVMALLESSPAYSQLDAGRQRRMADDLVKIGSYSAELMRDIFQRSEQLGQTPAVLTQTFTRDTPRQARALAGRAPGPASDEFSPRAASNVARITQQTLNAIAFPTFVADLIKGTFQAIVNASIQQMEAYGALLSNVAKTVDQFMGDNITDNQARDWLAQRYPAHFHVETNGDAPVVKVRETDQPKPNFQTELGLKEDVDLSDDTAEETLVPAARRKLAENRHSMLATMVLMGINRIVITSGRIRAQMGFRINSSDTGQVHTATEFDEKNEASTSFGGGVASWFGGPSAEVKNTLTYVSSTKKDSQDELDVSANLTGEVDLKFKSDYFPMERFANPNMIALIQGNTPNPGANAPAGSATAKTAEVAD